MSPSRRFTAPLVALLAAALLAACATQTAPSASTSTTTVPPATGGSAGVDAAAYSTAMCPIFDGILALDPRLAAMRDAGAGGGDMTAHAGEVQAISDDLRGLLDELEAVPEWTAGANLRYQLITALHGIRARLLRVGDDPAARAAADELASLPFIASDAMDIAVQDAVQGGLTCEDAS